MPDSTEELMKATRMRLHLNVHEPIELVEMTMAFQGLGLEYHSFLKKNEIDIKSTNVNDIKLYITKIETNCILAEFSPALSMLGALAPFITDVNSVADFVRNVSDVIKFLIGAAHDKNLTRKDIPYGKSKINNVKDIVKLVGKNKNSELGLAAIRYLEKTGNDESVLEMTFTGDECKKAENGAHKVISLLSETEQADKEKVLMYFYQTNIDDPKSTGRTGDRAIINSISEKPLSVFILSEIDQQRIRHILDDKKLKPLHVGFVVDVKIEKNPKGQPKVYRILRVHSEVYDDEDE